MEDDKIKPAGKRPSWDEYWMKQAEVVASRGKCMRRNYGAVITTLDNVLISQGYTGPPRGMPHCEQLGKCWRKELNIPSGERYELCRSVHAEVNTVINAARNGARIIPQGSKLYLYGFSTEDGKRIDAAPCEMCKRVIINAGVVEIYQSLANGAILKQKISDVMWNDIKNNEIIG
ncbi:MAG: dCMP deaminase family protein [Candidatus Pacearchaeota archaeon]